MKDEWKYRATDYRPDFDNFMEQILQEISPGGPLQDFGQMNSARSEGEFPEILTLSFNQ